MPTERFTLLPSGTILAQYWHIELIASLHLADIEVWRCGIFLRLFIRRISFVH